MKHTLSVTQNGFHGQRTVPIAGTNWRRWNELLVAVDMAAEDAEAMFSAASCGASDCECGGYHAAVPASVSWFPDVAGTYLVDVAWIDDDFAAEIGLDLSDLKSDFSLPAVQPDTRRETSISVRASHRTADRLRELAQQAGVSQADVVHVAIARLWETV